MSGMLSKWNLGNLIRLLKYGLNMAKVKQKCFKTTFVISKSIYGHLRVCDAYAFSLFQCSDPLCGGAVRRAPEEN